MFAFICVFYLLINVHKYSCSSPYTISINEWMNEYCFTLPIMTVVLWRFQICSPKTVRMELVTSLSPATYHSVNDKHTIMVNFDTIWLSYKLLYYCQILTNWRMVVKGSGIWELLKKRFSKDNGSIYHLKIWSIIWSWRIHIFNQLEFPLIQRMCMLEIIQCIGDKKCILSSVRSQMHSISTKKINNLSFMSASQSNHDKEWIITWNYIKASPNLVGRNYIIFLDFCC